MENMLKISKPEPQKLDEVDHTMASMALMICHDLTAREQGTLLFELQKYVHNFISLCVDKQQYQQNAMAPQPLIFVQGPNQYEQLETFMGILHQM